MSPIAATLIWFIVVSGPQGGLITMPNGFDTRDACEAALAEYAKKPTPTGWSLQCIPDGTAYDDSEEETPAPAQ